MTETPRFTPYLLLAVLTLGSGLGVGLGLSESPARLGSAASTVSANASLGPTSSATRHAESLLFELNQRKPEKDRTATALFIRFVRKHRTPQSTVQSVCNLDS